MYPQWLIQMFTGNPCVKCRVVVTTDDIDAVGIRRPMPYDNPERPLALVIATCKHCGQCMHFTLSLELAPVLDAVTALAATFAKDSRNAPDNDIGAMFQPAAPEDDAMPPLPIDRPRPSRRRNQPLHPPTQKELQAFLKRMRATPFKRGSKGYKRWMKRMGVDLDSTDGGDARPSPD